MVLILKLLKIQYVVIKDGDLPLQLIGRNVLTGKIRQFFLYLNPQDLNAGKSFGKEQWHDAAAGADIQKQFLV